MSEREFETWLSLLSGMLRLNPTQRAELSQELRTHLEDRLDDLIATGLTRDEAIASALEEFGDAAGLAHHFSQVAHLSKRRRIMRWTYGTIAASTCAILMLAAFWPQHNPQGPLAPNVVVSQEPETGTAAEIEGASGSPLPGGLIGAVEHDARSRIEAKMKQPLSVNVEFIETPFLEVVDFISTAVEVDILIDEQQLNRQNIKLDSPVTIVLRHGKVSADTLLKLSLRQITSNPDEYGYVVQDEILYLTDVSDLPDTLETVVYNCRDLFPYNLGLAANSGAISDMSMVETTVQFFQPGTAQPGYAPPGAIPGMPSGQALPMSPNQEFMELVMDTTGFGDNDSETIHMFQGLLVVKSTKNVHDEVRKLLEMMRAANGPGAAPAGNLLPYADPESSY